MLFNLKKSLVKIYLINCLTVFALVIPGAGVAVTSSQVLLVVGDSLSAGYGISPEKNWVSLLNKRFTELSQPMLVVNKSISGATTQNGVDRLPKWLEEVHPTHVVLALGSNDGLRGVSVSLIKNNLKKMIKMSEAQGAQVILIGFLIPPNYGPDYTEAFKDIFSTVAKEQEVPLVPFLLEGIAHNRQYFQGDGLHPNEAAQPILLENVWKILAPALNL
jgi:acyl-CoA thioesterase-1